MSKMKFAVRIAPLLLILSGCAATSLPEMSKEELPSDVPFQGANVILVEVDGDPPSIRERIVQSLRAENYAITQATFDQPTIETDPKTYGSGTQGSGRYFIEVPESAGEPVRLYGTVVEETVSDRTSFLQFQSYRVTPGGPRLSLTWQAWTAMNDIANIMATGAVLYDHD